MRTRACFRSDRAAAHASRSPDDPCLQRRAADVGVPVLPKSRAAVSKTHLPMAPSRRQPSAVRRHRARSVPALMALSLWLASAAACSEQVPRYEREAFATDPPQPGPLNGKIVVTNFGDDSLSVIDPETRTTLWR